MVNANKRWHGLTTGCVVSAGLSSYESVGRAQTPPDAPPPSAAPAPEQTPAPCRCDAESGCLSLGRAGIGTGGSTTTCAPCRGAGYHWRPRSPLRRHRLRLRK